MATCLNCNCIVEEDQLYCESCLQEIEKEQNNDDYIDDLLKQAMGAEETESLNHYDPLKQSLGAISSLEDEVIDLGEILANDANIERKKRGNIFKRLFSNPEQNEVNEEEKAEQEQAEQLAKEKKLEKEKKKQEKKKRKADKQKKEKELKEKKKEERAKKKQIKLQQSKEVEQPVEKLNKVLVSVVVFAVILFGAFLLYQTNNHHYQLAVKEANRYYEKKEYELAYKKLLGVNRKEEEEELFQKLEQIMLVYNPYCSYENYETMNRKEEALHYLLFGYRQYINHKDEAKKCGVENDYKHVYNQMIKILEEKYSITPEQAEKITRIEDSKEYTKQILALLAKID